MTLGLTVWFYESPHLWTSIWALEGVAFALIGFAFRDRQMLVTSSLAFTLTLLKTLPTAEMIINPTGGSEWWDPNTTSWLWLTGTLGVVGSSYWWIPRIPGIIVGKSWLGRVKMQSFSDAFLAVSNLTVLKQVKAARGKGMVVVYLRKPAMLNANASDHRMPTSIGTIRAHCAGCRPHDPRFALTGNFIVVSKIQIAN